MPLCARYRIFAAAMLAAASLLAVSTAASAQQVVALVNGTPITNLDVEHRAKFIQLSTKKPASRREALDSLIDEILEINEAKRFSIEAPDSDIENSYAGVATRMGIDKAKLTQLLVAGGASDDTLKRRLRAQLVWTNLVRGRYKSSMEVGDKDVEAQLRQNPEKMKNDIGYEYVMRPVVFIVPGARPRQPMTTANATPKPCAPDFKTATTGLFLRARSKMSRSATKCRSIPPILRSNCAKFSKARRSAT